MEINPNPTKESTMHPGFMNLSDIETEIALLRHTYTELTPELAKRLNNLETERNWRKSPYFSGC